MKLLKSDINVYTFFSAFFLHLMMMLRNKITHSPFLYKYDAAEIGMCIMSAYGAGLMSTCVSACVCMCVCIERILSLNA